MKNVINEIIKQTFTDIQRETREKINYEDRLEFEMTNKIIYNCTEM